MTEKPTRIEKDSMGEMTVPADALHGASTHRAVLNFPVSGYRFPRPFIRALGLIKWAAAKANQDLGLLDANRQRRSHRRPKKSPKENSTTIFRSTFFRPAQARAPTPTRTK